MPRYLNIDKVIFPSESGNHTERLMFTFRAKKQELSAFLSTEEAEKVYADLKDKLGLNDQIGLADKEIDDIVEFQNDNKKLCFSCKHRMRECFRCVMVCESPIERDLFLGLLDAGLNPQLQAWIARNGNMYPRESNFSPRDCLTRPDFYFETDSGRFCIYADGFTYHNKSEDKVGKDRNIDNQLQNYGYRVLRYTGKRIREDLNSVVKEVKQMVEE